MSRSPLRAFRDTPPAPETVPGSEPSGAPGGAEGGEAGAGGRRGLEPLAEAAREHAEATLGDRAGQAESTGSTSSAAAGDDKEKKPKKTDDEKRADFSRLASRRLSRALDALDSFANLSNAQSYAWSEEQESKIFGALRGRVEALAGTFAAARANTASKKPAKPLSFTV